MVSFIIACCCLVCIVSAVVKVVEHVARMLRASRKIVARWVVWWRRIPGRLCVLWLKVSYPVCALWRRLRIYRFFLLRFLGFCFFFDECLKFFLASVRACSGALVRLLYLIDCYFNYFSYSLYRRCLLFFQLTTQHRLFWTGLLLICLLIAALVLFFWLVMCYYLRQSSFLFIFLIFIFFGLMFSGYWFFY